MDFVIWLVSTTALPFSSDFDKIFKIAFLYIKDNTFSFLSWLGDFRKFTRTKSANFCYFRLVSTIALPFFIRY